MDLKELEEQDSKIVPLKGAKEKNSKVVMLKNIVREIRYVDNVLNGE